MRKLLARKFIILLFVLCSAYSGNAAASPEEAQQFVEKVSHTLLEVINSDAGSAQKEKQISELFLQTVDVKWIARFALGKYWNQASDEQRAKYLEVHKKFLLNGYIPKFREYNNQKIKVTKSSQISEDEYLVETKIISQDGTEVNVSYKVKKHEDAKYIAFDVIAEGVSLITTERADFASVLSRDGIDALITKLGEKR